ncbi:hypothetical protein BDR22DRAFT_977424 [Usnea florida]
MARPFDKYLSLTGPKPAGSARSRRATFPATTAEMESRTTARNNAPAQDKSHVDVKSDNKDEKKPKSELKPQTLSRRATFPSTDKTELPNLAPLTAPVEKTSQDSDQIGKKNEPQYKGEPMHEILPQLYLGDLRAAENTEELSRKDISFVLTMKEGRLTPDTRDAYRKARISHVQISKSDLETEDLLTVFEPVCDMIEGRLAKKKGVLVHCLLGKSRSVTVVMAFIMRQMNVSFQEAKVLVQSKRAIASPNNAFRGQLLTWEKCKFDLRNVRMVGLGTPSDPWAQGLQNKKKGRKVAGEGKAEQKGHEGQKEIKKGTDSKEVMIKGLNENTNRRNNVQKPSLINQISKFQKNMDRKAAKPQASGNDQQSQQPSLLPVAEVVLTAKGAAILKDDEGHGNPRGAKENAKGDTSAEDQAKKDETPRALQEHNHSPQIDHPASTTSSEVVPTKREARTPSDATEGEGPDIGIHSAKEKDPNKDPSSQEDSSNKDMTPQESQDNSTQHPPPFPSPSPSPATPLTQTPPTQISAAHPPNPTETPSAEPPGSRPLEKEKLDAAIKDEKCDSDHPQTASHSPPPDVIRAALKPLYQQHPAMGKKKLLRMLNEGQGWDIGCKEFRGHWGGGGGG